VARAPVGHARPAGQALPVAQALDGSESFVSLMQRLALSRRCYAAVAPLLPEALRDVVRSGPLADGHWSLLADSAAAAAKLRQCLPTLQTALADAGLPVDKIRVKVSPRH
jgi:hypothetical protein